MSASPARAQRRVSALVRAVEEDSAAIDESEIAFMGVSFKDMRMSVQEPAARWRAAERLQRHCAVGIYLAAVAETRKACVPSMAAVPMSE